jgi:DNA-binding CsgD family transcriptional regulator
LSTKEIAERLEISPSTASIHVCHMYEKLGVHRAVSAVRYAIRVGFMSA